MSRKCLVWALTAAGIMVGWDLVEITSQNAAEYAAMGAQFHCRVGRAPGEGSSAGPSARICVGHSGGFTWAWLHQEKVRAGNIFSAVAKMTLVPVRPLHGLSLALTELYYKWDAFDASVVSFIVSSTELGLSHPYGLQTEILLKFERIFFLILFCLILTCIQ